MGGLASGGCLIPPEIGLRSACVRNPAMSENDARYSLTQRAILFIFPFRSFLAVA